jgi:hypothetical protein
MYENYATFVVIRVQTNGKKGETEAAVYGAHFPERVETARH